MIRFWLKNFSFLCITLIVVSFIVFCLTQLSPVDAARAKLGAFATAEQVEHLTHELGLDRPVLERYAEYIGGVLSGDLGQSLHFGVPVSEIILSTTSSLDGSMTSSAPSSSAVSLLAGAGSET